MNKNNIQFLHVIIIQNNVHEDKMVSILLNFTQPSVCLFLSKLNLERMIAHSCSKSCQAQNTWIIFVPKFSRNVPYAKACFVNGLSRAIAWAICGSCSVMIMDGGLIKVCTKKKRYMRLLIKKWNLFPNLRKKKGRILM